MDAPHMAEGDPIWRVVEIDAEAIDADGYTLYKGMQVRLSPHEWKRLIDIGAAHFPVEEREVTPSERAAALGQAPASKVGAKVDRMARRSARGESPDDVSA